MGYGVMRFLVEGMGSPKFSVPPRHKTIWQTPKCFRGTTKCSRFLVTMPRLLMLRFHTLPWRSKTFFCLCVCVYVSVTLLNERDSAHDFAIKALEYRNHFDNG